jgi:hypothetical protein
MIAISALVAVAGLSPTATQGREGKGNGPDGDPDRPAGNFTDRMRLA